MAFPKFILFDFDGVIVNTFDISYSTYVGIYPNATHDEYRELFNNNIYEHDSVKKISKGASHVNDIYFKEYTPRLLQLKNDDAMTAVVRDLSEESSLVIVSSAVSDSISQYLDQHDMQSLFKKIYGADVHRNKHVKIEMALKDFSMKKEDSVMITDTLGDIREATAAGVVSVGVTWGFHDRETLNKGKPKYIVETPSELLDVLRELT